jgi:ABC-type bacteriocin/lantibiotic exporter with double-glycine peptidase domain
MLPRWLIYRRLPWVRVLEPRDCGASAFASIAHYYRHHLTLEQARTLVGTDRNGTTLAGLRDGGRAIGLDARAAQAIYEALGEIHLPAIAHLNGTEGHYVVVYRWTPTAVVVLDPGRGIRRLRRAEFEEQWSGYLVEYLPTPALRPRAPDVRPVVRFFQLLLQDKGALGIALAFSLVATSLGWAASFFLRELFDHILPQRDTALLVALGAGLILVSGLQAVLQLGRLWLTALVGRRIHQGYGMRYIERLMRLPLQVFDARCVAGLVMRVTQAEQIQLAITEGAVGLLSDGVMFLGALGVILSYDPVAAAIACGAVPLILGVIVLLNDRAYDTQLASLVRLEEFGSHMVDTFDGLRTIKTFSAEEKYEQLLAGKLGQLARARFDNRLALALPTAWSLLATSLITAVILWYGSSRVLAGQITAGDLMVLFGMVTFYLIPVQRFPNTLLTIRGALVGIERLEEICTLPEERERTVDPTPLPPVRGRVVFEHVSFEYKPRQRVLKDLTFTVEPGETVAIVGETGSGKTSLANLIAGFYLPTEGEVTIDGISTRHIRPEELRRAISAVFQNTKLLQQSVRDNITLMDDIPLDAVQQAARLANADEFISRQLYGYEAQVARAGDNFSSGQVQRIAIARALLKDAPILILDEATSNLDSATERGILRALEENRRGRTTIVIAHRLSTIVNVDRILVMHEGEIVEAGTHEELLTRRGRYYDLFHWQVVDPAPDGWNGPVAILGTGGGQRIGGNDHLAVERRALVSAEVPTIRLDRLCRSCGHPIRGRFCTQCGCRWGLTGRDSVARPSGMAYTP